MDLALYVPRTVSSCDDASVFYFLAPKGSIRSPMV